MLVDLTTEQMCILGIKTWYVCTMAEAIIHATGRKVDREGKRPEGLDYDSAAISFTDGTAIACKSDWAGPCSEVPHMRDPTWEVYRS